MLVSRGTNRFQQEAAQWVSCEYEFCFPVGTMGLSQRKAGKRFLKVFFITKERK
jgi:hypothetical protein